ncbi:MAG TPA: NAD-dependent epimerase/dehydratase family protein [Candidatus Eisenbacteria bacterium]
MNVLVTGGRGFLGRHLIAHLGAAAPDARVHALARDEIERTGGGLPALLGRVGPDVVLHLAGRLTGSEAELRRDNDEAAARLFEELLAGRPGALVVLAGSAAVYGVGGSRAKPVDESVAPTPRGIYAETKLAAERHAGRFAAAGGRVVVARISNPVGPGMGDHLLCGTIARQIVAIERGRQDPVLTLGDLSPLRDFIHARDVASALWHLVRHGAPGEAYNVATGDSVAAHDVVRIFLGLARVRPIEVQTAARGSTRSALPEQWLDNRKLRATGWKPERGLERAATDLLAAERDRE